MKQQYLGRAEQVVARLEGQPPEPTRVRVTRVRGQPSLVEYGSSLAPCGDRLCGRTRARPRFDCGNFYAVSGSPPRVGFLQQSPMARGVPAHCAVPRFSVREGDLRSQRFWDHRGYLTGDRVREVERRLAQHMAVEFDWDLSPVVYDATNFYPGIDTQTAST